MRWSEPNRTAAEAVLAVAGTVRVQVQGSSPDRPVTAAGRLPEEYFRVTSVSLASVGKLPDDLPEKLAALSDAKFDGLTVVDVVGAGLSADALDTLLAALPETVADLSLARTHAGDSQLALCSQRLKGLQRLNLIGTEVTAAGVTAAQKALPNCSIRVSEQPHR
jgi:hypothetical protein